LSYASRDPGNENRLSRFGDFGEEVVVAARTDRDQVDLTIEEVAECTMQADVTPEDAGSVVTEIDLEIEVAGLRIERPMRRRPEHKEATHAELVADPDDVIQS
jgi:hypothetical protein